MAERAQDIAEATVTHLHAIARAGQWQWPRLCVYSCIHSFIRSTREAAG